MFCVSLIGMSPGWICRNFPEKNSPIFLQTNFQAFSEEHALLDSKLVSLTRAAPELTMFCRISVQQNTIYWVGRYLYALEPIHKRDGYIGAGLWTIDRLAEPDKLTRLLGHLSDRSRALMRQNSGDSIDFSRLTWSETQVDDEILQETLNSAEPVENSFKPSLFAKTLDCYIDASSEKRSYDAAALLRFAQTKDCFQNYRRIFISKTRDIALRENAVSLVDLKKISKLSDDVKNALLEEPSEETEEVTKPKIDAEAASQAGASVRGVINSKVVETRVSSPQPKSTVDADRGATGSEPAVYTRISSVEQFARETRAKISQIERDERLLQIGLAAIGVFALAGLALAIIALVRTPTMPPALEEARPKFEAAQSSSTTPPPSQPPVETEQISSADIENETKKAMAAEWNAELNAELTHVSDIRKLLKSQECQKLTTAGSANNLVVGGCARQVATAAKQIDSVYSSLTQLAEKIHSSIQSTTVATTHR